MIVGMVIVLVSPDVTVEAYVVCSDKMLLNVVMMLSIFGVDKLMGFSSMGSCSAVFVTRTESVKILKHLNYMYNWSFTKTIDFQRL